VNDGSLPDRQQLELAIAAQEGLRGLVPDEIVDTAIAALRERLHIPDPDAQRRRQVTVLFADVSGFTSMSSRLDAEVVASVMNELWSRLDQIVVEHGGRIDKHIGDAVMAVWGASSTAEDDPERAVRAGLAMQHELVWHGSGDRVAMRVGINTGPVHLGAVGAGAEFTAIGDTVNVASRVQGVTPLGAVLVTHDTYRHIRGVFDVNVLEPVSVKGKVDPIRVYLVQGAKARAFRMPTRGVEGVETRMIGRARELGALQAEFERVVDQPTTRRVTVIGDAGIGKSRLLDEFQNWVELHPARAALFKGRALATRGSVAFGLVRDVLADRFGVADSDSLATATAKLRGGLGPVLADHEADVVAHWLGFDLRTSIAVQRLLGSGQLAAAARAHLFRYVESIAADVPVIILLEDLHWADEESLVLVDELVAHWSHLRLLVVGVGRPVLLERDVAVGLLERSSTALLLEPLGDAAMRELVAEVLQRAVVVPDDLTNLILERADGNAFYVEELVKMLIEDGAIDAGAEWDSWAIHVDRLDAARVPETLTGVLQARLDSLAPADRDALQRSSVVGRVFWDATVDTLGAGGTEATVRSLETARRRELVFRQDRSSFDDTTEYMFKHALLRDVTYETVLLRDRQRLHGLVAGWLSDHAGERSAEYAGLIATHLRMAGDLTGAAELLRRAGVASLESGNSPAARRNFAEAFDLWRESGGAPPVDALIAMAEACVRIGDIADALRYDEEALQRAVATEHRAAALFVGSWIASERGERARERALLDEAMRDAEEIGGVLLVRILTGLSWCEVLSGNAVAAGTLADRADDLARELHDLTASREVFALLGVIAGMGGHIQASLEYSSQGLVVAVDAGDLEGQALAHSNLGVARHLLGDERGSFDEYHIALDHYRQSKALNRRLGRKLREGMTTANIAQVYVRLGQDADARRLIPEAIGAVRQAGGTATLMFCVLAEADRRLVGGDERSALALIGHVRRHPAVTSDNNDEIARILGRFGLSVDAVDQPSLPDDPPEDFDAVVDRILGELRELGDLDAEVR
jgi:class 3 adenylate cyclase/tetratricopeptide (TPR) repeat protein